MIDNSINLMRYALIGIGTCILIGVCLIVYCFKGSAKRRAKREAKHSHKKKGECKSKKEVGYKSKKRTERKAKKKAKYKAKKEAKYKKRKARKKTRIKKIALQKVVGVSRRPEGEQPKSLYIYKDQVGSKDKGKKYSLENSLTIGRKAGYHQLTIKDDLTISGNHCKIYQRNNKIYISDLNSTNGTYVNDNRVKGEMPLSNNDKIRIGQNEYRIEIEGIR